MNHSDLDPSWQQGSTVVILAAGKASRMRGTKHKAKAFETICSKAIIQHQLDTILDSGIKQVVIVINPVFEKDFCRLKEQYPSLSIQLAMQSEAKGTAHATMQALPLIESSKTIIIAGDTPLITKNIFTNALSDLKSCRLTVAVYDNPEGFGRIIRNSEGQIQQIVEQKDCTLEQASIKEASTGIISATTSILKKYCPQISNTNQQKEFYLTDLVNLLVSDGHKIQSNQVTEPWQAKGVNTPKELCDLERAYSTAQCEKLIAQGVKIKDAERFDCRGQLSCGKNVTIDINVIIEGVVHLGDDVSVGASCILRNCTIEKASIVKPFSIIEDSYVHESAQIGPYAYCRNQTKVGKSSEIGCFVESKQTVIGDGSKAKHLSYLGNLSIGKKVNIGAGVIHCNYDGSQKHTSNIGDHAFVGANTSIVAPLSISANATIAAGSTVTKAVPENALAISRARQENKANWKSRKKQSELCSTPIT